MTCDSIIANRLRSANKFLLIFAKTNKLKIRLFATDFYITS